MTNCDCRHSDCNCGSSSNNSGFVFGLICGAIIGAVIAVIIYKNNKTEVFEKLEQKIKSFFEDLIPKTESETDFSPPSKSKPSVKKIITNSESLESKLDSSVKPKITPIFVKAKKPLPKTFIKPKR
jgi:gas vesicle protein